MQRAFNSKAMTLIELVLAIMLLNVIILTAVSMELGLRRLFSSTDIEVRLLDEATPILTIVTKDINRGIGDFLNSPYDNTSMGAGNPTFRFRLDADNDAKVSAGDRWAAYRFVDNGGQHILWYYRNASASSYEILSQRVMNFSVSPPVNGTSAITLRLRMDPATGVSFTNPEITINTSAQFREYPLN